MFVAGCGGSGPDGVAGTDSASTFLMYGPTDGLDDVLDEGGSFALTLREDSTFSARVVIRNAVQYETGRAFSGTYAASDSTIVLGVDSPPAGANRFDRVRRGRLRASLSVHEEIVLDRD